MENRFRPGDIVQHFKREMLDEEECKTNKYLYEIIGTATHSETRESMMVYKPLYEDYEQEDRSSKRGSAYGLEHRYADYRSVKRSRISRCISGEVRSFQA